MIIHVSKCLKHCFDLPCVIKGEDVQREKFLIYNVFKNWRRAVDGNHGDVGLI